MYTKNFEKQKDCLALNIFHGKTKAVLLQQKMMGTARFLDLVLRMWNCLNMKSPEIYVILNDKYIKPFFDSSDEKSTFLQNMAIMFKQIDH